MEINKNPARRAMVFFLGLAVAGLVFASVAFGQDAASVIEYRQKVMGSIGNNMGSIGHIMKFKLPQSGNIAGHAANINTSAKMILAAFKQQLAEGKTDAKAAVWSDWAKFEKATQDLIDESAKLASVAQGGDMAAIGGQMKKVGGTCKGCHEDFRKPKEESYKRK